MAKRTSRKKTATARARTRGATKPATNADADADDDDEAAPRRYLAAEDLEAGFQLLDKIDLAALRRCDSFELTATGVRCHKTPRTRDTNNPFAVGVVAHRDIALDKGTATGIPQGTKFQRTDAAVVTFQKSLRKGDAVSFRVRKHDNLKLVELCIQRIAGVFVFTIVGAL